MAPGHILSVDGPRPHTSNRWSQATDFNLMAQATHYQLMDPGHTLCVIWSYTCILSCMWSCAIHLKCVARIEPSTKRCVAWGHLFKVCSLGHIWEHKVCGLGPSNKSVWPGTKNVRPGATYLKCVAWGHLVKVCGLGPST